MTTHTEINKKKLSKLRQHGYKKTDTKTDYEDVRYKGPASIVLYKSGKLLVQGSKDAVKQADKLLAFIEVIEPQKQRDEVAIGSDETLKGDTFGGIVVCAFMADAKIREQLREIGVKDSKDLSRPQIVKLAQELMQKFPKNYHVENIFPADYNKLNAKNSVTEILDKLHQKCFKALAGRKKILHVVDLYPGCSVGTTRVKRAESKYVEVAAASIIARYEGLKQIKQLEMRAGFFIPLGSTHVDPAMLEIKKKSLDPKDYVKLKFKNVVKFFG